MFEPRTGERYDMPVVFGPSLYPAQSEVKSATLIATSFRTEPEAASRLMPQHLAVGSEPIIYVNRLIYDGIDYLGGRGYEELIVAINAVYERDDERIEAPYVAALWVSDIAALIGGREFLGHPKLHGELPKVIEKDDRVTFEAGEYGATFLKGEVRNLRPLPARTVEKIRGRISPLSFGWKYVAGPDGSVDADYATLLSMTWNYQEAWTGEGEVDFLPSCRADLPVSWRIVDALAGLPVLERKPAFMAKGSAVIDRAATRRLAPVRAG